MKKQQGFSLIELLIVVAIIAIIAAIAIPNLMTARQTANESGAVANLRTIGSAVVAYTAVNSEAPADLGTTATNMKEYLDVRLSSNRAFNGYTYSVGGLSGVVAADKPSSSLFLVEEAAIAEKSGNGGRIDFQMGGDFVVRYKGNSVSGIANSGDGIPVGQASASGT